MKDTVGKLGQVVFNSLAGEKAEIDANVDAVVKMADFYSDVAVDAIKAAKGNVRLGEVLQALIDFVGPEFKPLSETLIKLHHDAAVRYAKLVVELTKAGISEDTAMRILEMQSQVSARHMKTAADSAKSSNTPSK